MLVPHEAANRAKAGVRRERVAPPPPEEEERSSSLSTKPPATCVSRPKGTPRFCSAHLTQTQRHTMSIPPIGALVAICRAQRQPLTGGSRTILASTVGGLSHRGNQVIPEGDRGEWLLAHNYPQQGPGRLGRPPVSASEFHLDGPASTTHCWDPGMPPGPGKDTPRRWKLMCFSCPLGLLPYSLNSSKHTHTPGPLHLLFYRDCSALRSWQDAFVRALPRCHLLWVLRSLEQQASTHCTAHCTTPWHDVGYCTTGLCGAASGGNSGKSCLAVVRAKPGPPSFWSCCHLPAFFSDS